MSVQSTTPKGVAALRREEGEVLRAYRDVVGRWTIGVGITSATGIKVTPGMTITRAQSRQMLTSVLRNIYEPAVARAMPNAKPHEFDAGVSFHFNTGSIERASWVWSWIQGRWPEVRTGMLKWVRGGGKVLPALRARRLREYAMLRNGEYGDMPDLPPRPTTVAAIVLPLNDDELRALREGLRSLGYAPGTDTAHVSADAVRAFQAAHNLTVDGVIGRATLSTLQRRLDARSATVPGAGAAGVGGALITAPTSLDAPAFPVTVGPIVLALGLVWLAVTAWRYRDVIAAKIAPRLPKLAAWLRAR